MEFNDFTIIQKDKNTLIKPIKIVYQDEVLIIPTDDGNIEIRKKLSPMEAVQFIEALFGTTDLGILDCSDMTDKEIDKIVDEWNSIPEEYVL